MTEQLVLFDTRGGSPAETAALPLSIRESRRARRLILRLVPPHTLELVVPRGARAAEVTAFVHANRRWIERARREIAAHYSVGRERLPTRVALAAIGQTWLVSYRHEPGGRSRCLASEEALDVWTAEADYRSAEASLRGWLLEQARLYLIPWLLREAELMGRRPKSVQVRLQRTRWGSCSSSGTVSLNAGLLFLDPAVVRYLLVHELCHLTSLDHSRRFWRAVERFEPNYRALDRRLTEAWAEIPLWAHARATRDDARRKSWI
jgi:predicted metal-dependent hydrolase